jgi:hypothetical protein
MLGSYQAVPEMDRSVGGESCAAAAGKGALILGFLTEVDQEVERCR